MDKPAVVYGYRFNECKVKLSAVVKLETNRLIEKLVDYLRSNYKIGIKVNKFYVLKATVHINLTSYRFKIIYDYNSKIKLNYFELV